MPIHPSAVISKDAKIADSAEIGPFCLVSGNAVIGDGCKLRSHVTVHENVVIGKNNVFHQGCSVGDYPQDFSFSESDLTTTVIGDNNIFREYVTVHRGTLKDRAETTIGNNCLFMAYAHIAHDCEVQDHVILTNNVQLAGHTIIMEYAGLSAFVAVHQHCRVGRYAYIGAGSIIVKDIIPFALASPAERGRAGIYGPNLTGLKRKDFSKESLRNIRSAFKTLFSSKLNTSQAIEVLEQENPECPDTREIIDFIGSAKRGITK
jgi:UDP-N-acetylglucosamine acyltransferase